MMVKNADLRSMSSLNELIITPKLELHGAMISSPLENGQACKQVSGSSVK